MNRFTSVYIFFALFTSCAYSTYSGSRYSVSVDNIVILRTLADKKLNVGPFTSTKPNLKEIMCRGVVGPIKNQDGEPFSEFIRKALIDELVISNVFSSNASVTITGNLDYIDFSSSMYDSSNNGVWNLILTVHSSNGISVTLEENYSYTSSWNGEPACNQTAQALMPAVQDLIGKLIRSPEFSNFFIPIQQLPAVHNEP